MATPDMLECTVFQIRKLGMALGSLANEAIDIINRIEEEEKKPERNQAVIEKLKLLLLENEKAREKLKVELCEVIGDD